MKLLQKMPLMNEWMDDVLLENEEYKEIQNKIDEQIDRFNNL